MDIETVVETGTGVRLTADREELVRRLAIVSRALSTRTTVQVLSGILLEAEGDRLTLAATDMELSLRSSLPTGFWLHPVIKVACEKYHARSAA